MLELIGKKILVVGLGMSGISSAKFLKQRGAQVKCTDSSSNDDILIARSELESLSIPVEIGGHTESFYSDTELVVTSPGVPPSAPPIMFARKRNIPVIGEIELAWRFCHSPVIAITGSNGKSTTATLLNEVFKNSGIKSRLCGNIGIPLVQEVAEAGEDEILVVEVSSFQLETIEEFKPRVSIILNITPNHLDRYSSMKEYTAAKLRILDNQDTHCFSILNDNLRNGIATYVKKEKCPRLIFFGKDKHSDVVINSLCIIAEIEGYPRYELLRNEIKYLMGEHNIENIAAVIGASIVASTRTDAVTATVKKFRGIEHRIEYVAEINGVRYINDSKATTVDAVITALDTVGNNIILIAGGRDKGADFSKLNPAIKQRVKALVLIGESAGIISKALDSTVRNIFAADMRDAVVKSSTIAVSGDTVLLSPACASFDMFKNFEERGEIFKKEVLLIKNKDKINLVKGEKNET